MQHPLVFLALIVFAIQAHAQAPRSQFSGQAQQFEAAVRNNSNDTAARGALLEYYFLGKVDSAVAIPARRRHILWLIENRPADRFAGGPAATIDAAGHHLADPTGFKLASDAWRAQISRQDVSAAALVNAAYFFKLSDKGLTISLLERALTLEPTSKEIGARLGDEYALAIMGVTMISKNGYPLGLDPRLTESVIAKQAREALTTSRNPYVLAKAGSMLSWQGSILFNSKKLSFDPMPLAGSALQQAMSLAPGDPAVANYVEQYRALLPDLQRPPARRADPAP